MSSFRKLKSYVTGAASDPADELKDAAIPVSDASCRGCADPCDEGHDEYPSRFDVDMETQMLGSVKPYARQLVVSTGKSDWEKEVTDAAGTLAAFLAETRGEVPKAKTRRPPAGGAGSAPPGVYASAEASKITILNGSHTTVSEEEARETVLVFPEYRVVTEVERSVEGARALWRSVGHGEVPQKQGGLKTYVLPYACVILLCSHKRRDKRCSIAAPKLEHTLTVALEREGWEVHTQLDDPSLSGSPLEELTGSGEEKEAEVVRRLKSVGAEKRVLIVRNSHMGGHKFAGNMIVNTPQGASVWYGRVTPHEVDAVVQETVIGGKVLPRLLRGGLNLSRPGHASLHDW